MRTLVLLALVIATMVSPARAGGRDFLDLEVRIGDRRPYGPQRCVSPWELEAQHAEIEAASCLSFDSQRKCALADIACRPGLLGEAQEHLVVAAMEILSFDSSRVEVLLALIGNPDFCARGRVASLDRLDALSFSSSRVRILSAMNERLRCYGPRYPRSRRSPSYPYH